MTIKQKQHLLAYLGYYTGEIDGKWGALSEMATAAFQSVYGLDADGIFGKATKAKILEVIGSGVTGPVEVETTADFWDEIEFFDRDEFACKCGEHCDGFPVEPDRELVRILMKVREHFSAPVIINSGVRCQTHNANVGGASKSQHMQGTAADIRVKGAAPETVAAYLETLLPNTGGIGVYSTFTHVDVRKLKSRWKG